MVFEHSQEFPKHQTRKRPWVSLIVGDLNQNKIFFSKELADKIFGEKIQLLWTRELGNY